MKNRIVSEHLMNKNREQIEAELRELENTVKEIFKETFESEPTHEETDVWNDYSMVMFATQVAQKIASQLNKESKGIAVKMKDGKILDEPDGWGFDPDEPDLPTSEDEWKARMYDYQQAEAVYLTIEDFKRLEKERDD